MVVVVDDAVGVGVQVVDEDEAAAFLSASHNEHIHAPSGGFSMRGVKQYMW